ncbi:YicC/YloC family endoribonuclease [Sediminibacillus albus]|uniref:TIGR00255 family protein n=1 Tax=Sediminibacillus albus TaxID=407036 RepID=A0A1G8W575_9BACI|nr:YicC/YloC family endoribonuclease [Sediminibacillus albus]SDJ73458.1 TIGR00255 family protein [Sediminibacillus albus]
MVWSMTGYGREITTIGETAVTVEIRSVNHRFLDISAKMPRSLLFLEEKIKRTIKSYFQRGRVEVFINIEGGGLVKRSLTVDWTLMDQYIEHLSTIKNRYDLQGNIPLEMITGIEDIFNVQEQEHSQDELAAAIIDGVDSTCCQVYEMRRKEGSELANDMLKRIDYIRNIAKWLGERREIVIMEYRDRIVNRLQEYLQDNGINDESRMIQEAAILAEKGDITEEVTRLDSHANQFSKTIQLNEAVGRKMDFILQEMLREANTIGSKSNDIQISEWVVGLKSEIEKIKEQVQNIE